MHVVLDDDEVSSDEDEPLQKRLRQLFGTGPTVLDEAVVADKEVVDKRAAEKRVMEEAAAKKATEERVVEEAAAKDATAGVSPAPDQVPSAAGAKRVVAPSGPTPSAKCPYRGVWKPRFVQLSLPLFSLFCVWDFILLLPFWPMSSPSGAAAAMGTAAADAAVRAAPGLAPVSEPRTLEGVFKDMVELEGEPDVVPEVVQEEAPAEGAMIAVHAAAAPPPSCGARAPPSSAPHKATTSGAATGKGMEVVLGHPSPYALGNISVGEAVSTAHQALSHAQCILRCEGEDLADERQCLQLWESMLKRTTMSERAAARAWQHGFNLQVEAIAQRDADSWWALADVWELYTSAKARDSVITK
jgi:hypothetical protein